MNQYISNYLEVYISYIGWQPNLLDMVVPQAIKWKIYINNAKATRTLVFKFIMVSYIFF